MKSKSLSEVSQILVCGGKPCKKDSKALRKAIAKAAEKTKDAVLVVKTACLGCCEEGPVVVVWPKGTCFLEAKPENAEEILKETGWVESAVNSGEDRAVMPPKRTRRSAEAGKAKTRKKSAGVKKTG